MKIIFIFFIFRDVPGCSGMFQNIPECSVFRVIFIDAHDIWLFASARVSLPSLVSDFRPHSPALQIFQWLDDSATCIDAVNVKRRQNVGILMVGHLEGKRKWVHFKFLSYQTSIHIPLSDGPTRSILVIYWTNKKKVKKANNAVISKFTSSVLPANNNEGKLCQSLPIKLKRTSHTKCGPPRDFKE